MKQLDKFIFLEITSYMLGIPPTSNENYLETFGLLSNEEKNEFVQVSQELHKIYNHINLPLFIPDILRANSVFEYNEVVKAVNPKILQFCADYEISLKEELTDDFKATAKKLLGNDYKKWFDKN